MSEEFMNGAGGEQGNANGEPQGYVQPEHSQEYVQPEQSADSYYSQQNYSQVNYDQNANTANDYSQTGDTVSATVRTAIPAAGDGNKE